MTGGDTLAAEWAGFETVLFVENDKFCQKVLNKHWPDVPIIGDIKDATKETMADSQNKGITRGEWLKGNDDGQSEERRDNDGRSRTNDGGERDTNRAISTVSSITLITGGFPCQPFSVAGKQRGKEDDRYLWPEMLRVIKEVRPTWVVAENVAGLIRMGLDDCISDLENIGYTTETYIIPACAVNAPHRRDRVFIVAHTRHNDRADLEVTGNNGQAITNYPERQNGSIQSQGPSGSQGRNQNVADTKKQSITRTDNRDISRQEQGEFRRGCSEEGRIDQWAVEPDVGRVAHGFPPKLDGGIDEVLQILWQKYGTTEMVKREIGQHLEASPVLLSQMLRRLDNFTEQGATEKWEKTCPKTASEKSLREMWLYYWLATASRGQKPIKQCPGKLGGTMPNLSQERPLEGFNMGNIWLQEPNIPRVASGIKDRVNRLKALGNAIVPQQIYPILKAIADKEVKA